MAEELNSYTPQDLADFDALMHELSATSFCNEELLNNALNDANVYVIRDEGHIVATGTLCIKHTLEFTIADVESVVVSSKCRGRGYGKELMTAMIEAAKKMNVHHIQLTSNPARIPHGWQQTGCIRTWGLSGMRRIIIRGFLQSNNR